MRKITEILRLEAAGMGIRDIAASVGAGKTTIYEYLARAEAAGLTWPLPEGLDEAALEARLFPPPCAELAARRPVPEWREGHRELKHTAGHAREGGALTGAVGPGGALPVGRNRLVHGLTASHRPAPYPPEHWTFEARADAQGGSEVYAQLIVDAQLVERSARDVA